MSMSCNYEEISYNEAKDLLRQWRENNERRSDDVMELWAAVLGEDINRLGNEKHLVLEQVIFAALDCHTYDVAHKCISMLSKEFPGSLRVRRYKAALLEANEEYDAALVLLDSIIKADETNSAARKRRVAILKAQGQLTEAIRELVDYLKKFMSDVEAWGELSALYLAAGELPRAAFCAEELLLHQPHHHLLHQRLADIRYTMGGAENLELAKTYYSQALRLNPGNMRALLGLLLTSNALLSQYKCAGAGNKRKEAWRAAQWAQARLAAPAPDLHRAMLDLAIAD